ncbi:MAG TPA: MarR family winged helix-turn-helix transcriptional regulator [Thermoanaerobaculia bacterium]|jgi:DNA-binding MarR family transcriptional regulator
MPQRGSRPQELSDADYQRLLQFRIGLRRFLHWSKAQVTAAGLTPAKHQLLLAIRGHADPRGPTILDVAGYLLLRHHSAVGLVDRAADAGLVVRRPDEDDRRAVRLRLTRRGARLLRELTASHLEELSRLGLQGGTIWEGLEE